MTRNGNSDVIQEVFIRLNQEFGNLAPQIIRVLVGCMGGVRLTFPDLEYLYRQERDRRIKNEFTGFNYEELAIRYRLKCRQVRRIVQAEEK